ncbi:Icc protein [Mariprofundus ferrinatatus]|uniref:Icc protein n=1 Tax=Mariprofundus ferrinatatus TaxID=1921087 RepID=A0A2K8L956_9PROT|nr:metallophosphoesterase [Mariprofundus ferrinatatus]ATX82421.1 Icc protein [Mariprofundus ferrinatatus]
MSLLLHISDSHLYEDPAGELKGVRPRDSYASVLKAAHDRFPNPDAVVLGGDMAQDEAAATYRKVAEMLPWRVPVMISPGNHANISVLKASLIPALEEHSVYSDHLQLEHWQVITLNSHRPGSIAGFLRLSELNRLRALLQTGGDKHTLIALHHPPLDVGSRWLDAIGLENRDEFWELIADFPQVRVILAGHIHQAFDTFHDGVRVLGSPSTCIQFKRRSDDFGMDDISPGYRWIRLMDNGQIQTAVERINGFIPPDLNNIEPY